MSSENLIEFLYGVELRVDADFFCYYRFAENSMTYDSDDVANRDMKVSLRL